MGPILSRITTLLVARLVKFSISGDKLQVLETLKISKDQYDASNGNLCIVGLSKLLIIIIIIAIIIIIIIIINILVISVFIDTCARTNCESEKLVTDSVISIFSLSS